MGLLTDLIRDKVERRHQDEQDQQKRTRDALSKAISDNLQAGRGDVADDLFQQMNKGLSPKAKKEAQQGYDTIKHLHDKFRQGPKGQQQGQQPTQAPQSAPQSPDAQQGAQGPVSKEPQQFSAIDQAKAFRAGPDLQQPASDSGKQRFNQGPQGIHPYRGITEASDKRELDLKQKESDIQQAREIAVAKARPAASSKTNALSLRRDAEGILADPDASEADKKAAKGYVDSLEKRTPEDNLIRAIKDADPSLTDAEAKQKAGTLVEKKAEGKTTSNAEQNLIQAVKDANPGMDDDTAKRKAGSLIVKQAEAKTGGGKLTDEDKLSRYLQDSGTVKDPEAAKKRAATMLVNLQTAKIKAAQAGSAVTFTAAELGALADWSIATGSTPAFGLSANNPNRVAFQKALANKVTGSGDMATALEMRTNVKAVTSALNDMTKLRSRVVSFADTAKANIEQAKMLSKQIGRTGSSLANEYLLNAQGKLEDYPELQKFKVATQTAANEYARVVNSATGNGISTDSARAEANSMISVALAKGSFDGAAEQMMIDMGNRSAALDATLEGLRTQLQMPPTGQGPVKAPPPANRKPLSSFER